MIEAARATRRHTTAEVWQRTPNMTPAEARAACDRLNLAAVLRAIREPTGDMVLNCPYMAGMEPRYPAIWRAMIDTLIAECEAGVLHHGA